MVAIEPVGLRLIEPDWTSRVPSPAHDALTPAQRQEHLAQYPDSYLGVTRGPGDLPPGMQWSSEQLLAEGRRSLDRLLDAGAFSALRPSAMYLYRLSIGDHHQTGIICGVPIAAYAEGEVRTHENINPDRASHLSRHLSVVSYQSSPIALAHRPVAVVDTCVDHVMTERPEISFVNNEGLAQTIWCVPDEPASTLATALTDEPLYLIDGHHRAAAALAHRADDGPGPADVVLSAVFPSDQLRNRAHHRVLSVHGELDDFLHDLHARRPVRSTTDLADVIGRHDHELALFGSGEWHLVTIPPTAAGTTAAARLENLEPVRLQRAVFEPALVLTGPDADATLSYRPGTEPLDVLAAEVDRTDSLLCAMRPVAIDDLLAVSDAGLIMPPKSTYFEPKARSGVFARPMHEEWR